jgi:hypothetical protein
MELVTEGRILEETGARAGKQLKQVGFTGCGSEANARIARVYLHVLYSKKTYACMSIGGMEEGISMTLEMVLK